MPQTLQFLVALLIQPHFHPMPKGEGLSRSGKAVMRNPFEFYRMNLIKYDKNYKFPNFKNAF